MKRTLLSACLLALYGITTAQQVSDFENVLSKVDTFWNGSNIEGGFRSGGAFYRNDFTPQWGSWNGFSASTMTDSVNGRWSNQYACIAGQGAGASLAYAVMYNGGEVILADNPSMDSVYGVYVNNSTYAARVMETGNAFAKKFGGSTGNDPDSFVVRFEGFDHHGISTGRVDFYLADFRDANNSNDYILKDWTWVDLSSIGAVAKLQLSFFSSDRGGFGINNPTYVCLDSLVKSTNNSVFSPLAADDILDVAYNSSGEKLGVLANDINPNALKKDLNLTIVEMPKNGSTMLSAGDIEFTPNASYNGYDTLKYSACHSGKCDTAEVIVLVNNLPIAQLDTASVVTQKSVKIDLSKNDDDEDKSSLTFSMRDTFKSGTSQLNGSILNYTASTQLGMDTASYEVCDKFNKCAQSQIIVTVTEASDTTVSIDFTQEGSDRVKVYPNPTKAGINIEGVHSTTPALLITPGGTSLEISNNYDHIDLSEYRAGLYYLLINEKVYPVLKTE